VQHVELRVRVGSTLIQIGFKDRDIVHKGDLLFVNEPTPYEIKLSEAAAQLANIVPNGSGCALRRATAQSQVARKQNDKRARTVPGRLGRTNASVGLTCLTSMGGWRLYDG
jgi:multidrug resistance efflux pump